MKDNILDRLASITEEEQIFFASGDAVTKSIYSRSSKFYVEQQHMIDSNICYGGKNALINMKTHIRLTDFPPHSHDYVEMMYVCQGEITHTIGNEDITLTAGDIIILGKDTIHSIKKTSINDIGIVLVISNEGFCSVCNKLRGKALINDDVFTQLTASGTSTYCLFHTDGIFEIENLIENIISPMISGLEKSPILAQAELFLLLLYLMGMPDVQSEIYHSHSKTDTALREFNAYIETNYATANLTEIAVLLGFTPTYLCRWTKQHYGMTFKELLREKRFSIAIELLSDSSLSINEIIQSIGYENSSYFYKEFNKRFGITPKAIRAQMLKEKIL